MRTPPYPMSPGGRIISERCVYITDEESIEQYYRNLPEQFLSKSDDDTSQNQDYSPTKDQNQELQQGQSRCHYHIFMITGNPGYIDYYHEYLSLLWKEMSARSDTMADISIYGTSLSGFSGYGRKGVIGLQGQIEYIESCLQSYVEGQVIKDWRPEHRVIVIGHSVGAYIGLEIVRRHREKVRNGASQGGFQILGFVGLWPTVTHIADSIRGRRVGWLLKLPFLAFVVGLIARLLMFLIGRSIVIVVLKLAGFTEHAAEVTARFLASRKGVYQALYMAGDEMREIRSDRWDDDIWGSASPSSPNYPRPKVLLCFGKDDHWVADHHRDELIKARGQVTDEEDWRPRMIIDDTGIPHSFCIAHSAIVAERTAGWVLDMIQNDGTP